MPKNLDINELKLLFKELSGHLTKAKDKLNRISTELGETATSQVENSDTLNVVNPGFYIWLAKGLGVGATVLGTVGVVDNLLTNPRNVQGLNGLALEMHVYRGTGLNLKTHYDAIIYKALHKIWENNPDVHSLFNNDFENMIRLYIYTDEENANFKNQMGLFNPLKLKGIEVFLNEHLITDGSSRLTKAELNELSYQLFVTQNQSLNPTNLDLADIARKASLEAVRTLITDYPVYEPRQEKVKNPSPIEQLTEEAKSKNTIFERLKK